MKYKRKLRKIKKELGYKRISAYISEGTLRINNSVFNINSISNVYVETVFHDSINIPINIEEKYNFAKGFVYSEILESPLGWLGGIETITTYEEVMIQRVVLILLLKNGITKKYITGIFPEFDDSLYECIEETNKRCNVILEILKLNGIEIDQNKKEKHVNLFQSILKWMKWIIKIYLYIIFFPFSILFFFLKNK